MTKQQEFLDYLKDPTKVRLKEAVRYYQDFNNEIRITFSEDSERYVIDILSDTFTAMSKSTEDFILMLRKFIDKPIVNAQLCRFPNHPYSYRRSFYIVKQP